MDITAWNWELDGWIIVAGVLCALSSALLGNFLVLRRLSLLGDAITHAVLPGLAIAYLISESRSSWLMYVGAAVVGLLTAVFTEWIRSSGKVDEGASMGVVFTSLFALGLVLIVWTADRVDLDPNCVLFGSIESIPLDTWTLAGLEIPRAVLILLLVTLLNLAFVVLFFKELKLAAFDSQFSDTMGYPAAWMHYALMMLVAVTAVACFESVGSVLVVAMLVVPPASALMLTHRLKTMIGYSSILAIIAAVSGHLSAIYLPRAFGYGSTSTSGMMAVMCGVLFVGCVLFGPQYGVVVRWSRQRSLARQILADDVLAWWYRQEENKTTGTSQPVRLSAGQWTKLASELGHSLTSIRRCTNRMLQQGLLQSQPDGHSLTDLGRERAKQLVRSHRLWEQYLIDHAQVDRQKIHDTAEKLEHFTDRPLRDKLFQETAAPETDPHGSPIPEEHPER